MRRDSAPRRESQPEIARNAGERTKVGSHWDNPANPHPTLNQSNNIGGIGASNQELFSQRGSGLVSDSYSDVSRTLLAKENDSTAEDLETYVVHGTQDPDINRELAHTLGRNNGQENACIAFSYKDNGADATSDLSPTIRAGNHDKSHANSGQPPAIALAGNTIGRAPENGGNGTGYCKEVGYTLTKSDQHGVAYGMQVRRLTPIECERLQGFP